MAEQVLTAGGYRVLTAADGPEGIRQFTAHDGEVTLILLDMTMPGMGGEEVFGILKSLRDDVRVLLSSGYDEQEVTQKFEGPGPAGFIQKPYRPSDLLAKIQDVLGARDRE
jgi:CheY-like chemotaxis protein